jgi:molybdate/tungstate transport system ATP-binding protein
VPDAFSADPLFFNTGKENRMIAIDHLTVRLTGFTLHDVNLTVATGEFFSLLGPTGAGKTLILESIAGLVKPVNGHIRIGTRDVTYLPPEKRGVGIVYQDHALFPHLNVEQNIAYGLRYRAKSGTRENHSLNGLVRRLELTHLLGRSIRNLSGGEKQRVALARALAIDPDVLLLDEPLSSLDPNFREEIRQLLKDLHQETGITVLMVTHDFSEAHFLAQRVAVIQNGKIEQVGNVRNVFMKPASPFVARFVGMKNIFPAVFNDRRATVAPLSFQIANPSNGRLHIAVRPEHIELFTTAPECRHENLMPASVAQISNQGVYSDVMLEVSGVRFHAILTTSSLHALKIVSGQHVYMRIAPEHIHLV